MILQKIVPKSREKMSEKYMQALPSIQNNLNRWQKTEEITKAPPRFKHLQ